MSRPYALQDNTEDGVVALRVFNCDTGSTELKTVNVKKDNRSSNIYNITLSSNSDDIYLQSDIALIKADRDGNMSVFSMTMSMLLIISTRNQSSSTQSI